MFGWLSTEHIMRGLAFSTTSKSRLKIKIIGTFGTRRYAKLIIIWKILERSLDTLLL